MVEYEPTPGAVEAFKRAWHEADAEGDEGNRVSRGLAAALAQHDAELRAEVERLRAGIRGVPSTPGDVQGLKGRQAATYRAGWEAAGREYRALLAGSGEQPGEDECTQAGFRYCRECRVRVDDEHSHDRPAPVVPDVVRELDAVMHHHADRADAAEAEADRLAALLDVAQEDLAAAEAPAVPDSADVRGELLHVLDSHGIDTYIDGTGAEVGVQNLITDILAVVRQGVTAEQGTKSMPATTSVTVYDEEEA